MEGSDLYVECFLELYINKSDRIHGIQIISNHKVILTVYGVYKPYENHSKEQLELYIDTLDKLQSMLDDSSAKTPRWLRTKLLYLQFSSF